LELKGKKILIVRLSSLGDVLLATPLVRTLVHKYKANVDFVVRDEYKDILKLNPNIKKLYLFTRNREEVRILGEQIRKENFDIIIDLQNNLRTLSLLKGVKGKVYRFRKRSFQKLLLVKFKKNKLTELPQIPVRYASTLPDLRLDKDGCEIFTDNNPSSLFQEGKKYIGIAPGSKHFTKMWPEEYFIQLASMLASDGYSIAIFGGLDDREICNKISLAVPFSLDLSNNNEILQTSADMKKCEAIVCNDSGLMHTAGASGVHVLAIFGSTVKEFGFTPYRTKNLIFENNSLNCRPCTHIGRDKCPLKHFKCMNDLIPAKAYKILKALINS